VNAHPQLLGGPGRVTGVSRRGAAAKPSRRALLPVLVWSLVTVAWAVAWAAAVLPHPFAAPDAVLLGAVFNATAPMVGIAFTLVVGMVGTAVGVALVRSRGVPAYRSPAAELLAWLLALTLVATLLHGQLLVLLGYLPVVTTLGWFQPTLWSAFLEMLRDPGTHLQLHVLVGVSSWVLMARSERWARRGCCLVCGRRHGWTAAEESAARVAALRRGRAAVVVGSVAALIYPAIRLPWLFGVPVGVDAATLAEWQQMPGVLTVGIAFGLAGLVGVVLMSGLVRDWGVTVPRWIPALSGRRVRAGLAVVPASIVSLGLVAMGRGWLTALVAGHLRSVADTELLHVLAFAAMLPWGLALGVATISYAQRRRGPCHRCGQGLAEVLPSQLSAARLPASLASTRP
jgi:hypothetical protein